MIKTTNPATGELIKEYEYISDAQLQKMARTLHEGQQEWKQTTFAHRSERLNRAADLLEDQKDELAEGMAREMGKPLAQGISEAEKCAWVCRYYAENAENFLAEEPLESDGSESFISYQPMGVVLAIMPWNFPFWQLFRFVAPALMAGNAGILKHAPNVTGCALKIEELLHEAGIPKNVFRTAIANDDQTQELIAHDHIAAVTLTGSTRAGKAVAATAGAQLKKTVLELGGSDPYLILADADVKQAAQTCVESRLINSGQSCIAAKRFIAVDDIYDDFVNEVVAQMRDKTTGNPLADESIDLGPMARADLRDDLHTQVTQTIEAGADCLLGGTLPEGDGFYYTPTVLANIPEDSPAYREELFGPVASIFRVQNEAEAIRVANDTAYGLGAAVFSGDEARARDIAATQLQAGCCFVNDFVKSDPRLPFGGIKKSGYGRELSRYGIREFVNIKTVYVA